MRTRFIDDILRKWKKDAGITHLMQYRFRNNVLTIYTDRPGALIGLCGERIARFTNELKSQPYPKINEVRLEDTDGIC